MFVESIPVFVKLKCELDPEQIFHTERRRPDPPGTLTVGGEMEAVQLVRVSYLQTLVDEGKAELRLPQHADRHHIHAMDSGK